MNTIKYDGVDFNADYAATLSLDEFAALHADKWPRKSAQDRDLALSRVHMLSFEFETPTDYGNSSSDASQVRGDGPDPRDWRRDTGYGGGGEGVQPDPALPEGD